jgi:hypothetical protein
MHIEAPLGAAFAQPSAVTDSPSCPVYIRLPRPGELEFYTGLSRGTLERILRLPGEPVKSVVFAQPGKSGRGVRCIVLATLLDYLSKLPSQPPARLAQPKNLKRPRRKNAGNNNASQQVNPIGSKKKVVQMS